MQPFQDKLVWWVLLPRLNCFRTPRAQQPWRQVLKDSLYLPFSSCQEKGQVPSTPSFNDLDPHVSFSISSLRSTRLRKPTPGQIHLQVRLCSFFFFFFLFFPFLRKVYELQPARGPPWWDKIAIASQTPTILVSRNQGFSTVSRPKTPRVLSTRFSQSRLEGTSSSPSSSPPMAFFPGVSKGESQGWFSGLFFFFFFGGSSRPSSGFFFLSFLFFPPSQYKYTAADQQ